MGPGGGEPKMDEKNTLPKATFVVRISFCQNETWQGNVTWLDNRQTQNFRSMMELLYLMDSALGHEQEWASQPPGELPEKTS